MQTTFSRPPHYSTIDVEHGVGSMHPASASNGFALMAVAGVAAVVVGAVVGLSVSQTTSLHMPTATTVRPSVVAQSVVRNAMPASRIAPEQYASYPVNSAQAAPTSHVVYTVNPTPSAFSTFTVPLALVAGFTAIVAAVRHLTQPAYAPERFAMAATTGEKPTPPTPPVTSQDKMKYQLDMWKWKNGVAESRAPVTAAAVTAEPASEPEPEPVAEVAEAAPEPVAEAAPEPVAEATPEPAAEPAPAKPAASFTAKDVQALRRETGAGMMDCKKALIENDGDVDKASVWLQQKGIASAGKKASRVAAEGAIGQYIHMGSRMGVLLEVNCETDFVARGEVFQQLVSDLAMQVAASETVNCVSVDDVDQEYLAKEREIEMGKEDLQSKPEEIRAKMVDGRMAKRVKEMALLEQPFIKDSDKTVSDVLKAAVATIGENIKVRRFVRYNLGEGLEKRNEDFAAEVAAQTQMKKKDPAPEPAAAPAPEPEAEAAKPVVAVSAKDVSALRKLSGAGMMDCKKALQENEGDVEKASIWLQQKGIASAGKKASRIAAEGGIGQYIHMGARLGVIVELNCETDFVARGDAFKELLSDIAMQIAANPTVSCVSVDDVDPVMLAKEREIEMGKEDLQSKPEEIRAKMVDGRMAKRVKEMALLEQPFIKDGDKTVGDVIKAAVATIGENIKVRRFEKYNLGEGIEKKKDDFAAEVAAFTAAAK